MLLNLTTLQHKFPRDLMLVLLWAMLWVERLACRGVFVGIGTNLVANGLPRLHDALHDACAALRGAP